MSHARAAIAGVLAAGLIVLFAGGGALTEGERAVAAFLALLSIIALLLGVNVPWRGKDDGS